MTAEFVIDYEQWFLTGWLCILVWPRRAERRTILLGFPLLAALLLLPIGCRCCWGRGRRDADATAAGIST